MLTDPGCRRERNEDSILLVRPEKENRARKGILAIVADGMGGHNAGDFASKLAVEAVSRSYFSGRHRGLAALDGLRQAVHQANRAIFEEAEANSLLRGMGTTVTTLLLKDNLAFFAHVGDSRLYRLRAGELEQLTEDHTLVAELVRSGVLTSEQAQNFPDRHVITRAVGTHSQVDVALSGPGIPVVAGDVFLLCSDGLHDLVRPDEIRRVLEAHVSQAACETLVTLARDRGGHDNISVIVIRIAENCPLEARTTPITRVDKEDGHE